MYIYIYIYMCVCVCVYYLTFSFCYLVYHRVQFLVLWFTQCIPILLESLRSDIGLNITDDTQLYISLDPDNELNFSSSLKNLQHYIADIQLWMTQNLLKLNDNKTNIIYLASSHCVKSLNTPGLQMDASLITPNGSVKNLGVIFDQCINMNEHVTSVCQAAYCHLKNIHCLKTFLTQEALISVVHAFFTSGVDYFNSLLYGISDYNINRLKQIQNSAACIMTNTQMYDHITPILQKILWLPVKDFSNNL